MSPVLAPSCLAFAVSLAAAQTLSREGAFEKLALVSANDPKTWAPAECTATPSTERAKIGATSWHWHVDVDHFAGEAKYPIGWPRISHAIPDGPLRDWSAWDFLHAWIYVDTSRATLPKEPVGLGVAAPDRANTYNRALTDLKKGEWVELNVPVAALPRPGDVRSLQFHISEANYRHGDRLDVYVNDLALVRYAEPTLFAFSPENAVLFSDAKRLPVRLQLLGVKPGGRAAIACELRREGKVAARGSAEAGRGPQRVVLALAGQPLAPGEYELRASVAGQPQPATAKVRVVDSPWR